MKKRDLIIFAMGFTLCLCICIVSIFYTNRKMQKEEQYFDLDNSSLISMMIQNESGEYEKANRTDWPTDGYNFNKTLSKCENGSKLAWRNDKVVVNTTTSDKCYIYFDLENGTEKFPYQIDSIEDLVRLSKEVADGDTKSGVLYVLTRDLDFQDPASYEDSQRTDFNEYIGNVGNEPLITGLTQEDKTGFVPIGNETNHFKGKFNGKNKKIDNLFINVQSGSVFNSLFGTIEDSEITNLQVSGTVTSSLTSGGVVCDNYGTSILDGLENYVNVTGTSSGYTSGGVISRNLGTVTIKNSQNYGNISGSNDTAGILGYTRGTAVIENSNNYGQITNTLGNNAGGIIGRDHYNINTTTINNSHNEGNVTGIRYTGGLIGYANGTVEIKNNSYNSGTIYKGEANNNNSGIGGLIGESGWSSNINIKDSYNTGDVIDGPMTQRHCVTGGLIGRNRSTLIIKNSYNSGVVKNNSSIDLGTYDMDLGGLIGVCESGNNLTKITNSYNTGDILNGNHTGGLVGYGYAGSKLLIYNSNNSGNINSHINSNHILRVGGIIGSSYKITNTNTMAILNSYNTGNINIKYDAEYNNEIHLGGLVGETVNSTSGKTIILNSYNSGSVINETTNQNYSNGIIHDASNNTHTLYLNNVYNSGNLSGNIMYGVGKITTTSLAANNVYYKQGLTASNQTINATPMTENNMKNPSFVTTLNNNIVDDTTIKEGNTNKNLTDIDPLLEGFTLSRWELGGDGYPTLINE